MPYLTIIYYTRHKLPRSLGVIPSKIYALLPNFWKSLDTNSTTIFNNVRKWAPSNLSGRWALSSRCIAFSVWKVAQSRRAHTKETWRCLPPSTTFPFLQLWSLLIIRAALWQRIFWCRYCQCSIVKCFLWSHKTFSTIL